MVWPSYPVMKARSAVAALRLRSPNSDDRLLRWNDSWDPFAEYEKRTGSKSIVQEAIRYYARNEVVLLGHAETGAFSVIDMPITKHWRMVLDYTADQLQLTSNYSCVWPHPLRATRPVITVDLEALAWHTSYRMAQMKEYV